MAQNPLAATIGKTPAGAQSTGRFDNAFNLMTATGGQSTMLAITAARLIVAGAGRINRIFLSWSAVPTGGALVINDVSTLAGAATSNQIISYEGSLFSAASSQVLTLDCPFFNGFVISALPTGATNLQLAVSYN